MGVANGQQQVQRTHPRTQTRRLDDVSMPESETLERRPLHAGSKLGDAILRLSFVEHFRAGAIDCGSGLQD